MKKFLSVVAMLALAAVLFTTWMYITTPDKTQSHSEPTKAQAVKIVAPVDLTGKWESKTSKAGTKMLAEVKDNTIFIQISAADGFSGLWYGSFDILQPGQKSISSKALNDPNRFVLSSADTKDFLYQDEQLIFDFSVMGTRTTIAMTRV